MILFFFESRNIKFLHWYRQQALFQSLSISFSGNQREWNKVFTWLCFLLSKEMTEFKKISRGLKLTTFAILDNQRAIFSF